MAHVDDGITVSAPPAATAPSGPVAVIGGGWAGMAAAVALARRGLPVTLFEAARQLGGRARRVEIDGPEPDGDGRRVPLVLDNGQHILIGAYRETLALMRAIGADPGRLLLRLPLELRYADGFHLRAPRLPFPLNLAAAMLLARGLPLGLAFAAMRFMRALENLKFRIVPDRSVDALLREHAQDGVLRSHLWEPLCVSALNTPIAHASAQVFATVLRDGLTGQRENSDLLVPCSDLGRLFPEPAAEFVRARGGSIRLGSAVRSIRHHAHGFRLDADPQRYARVVLAVGPQHAAALLADLPELAATRAMIEHLEYEPIVTCYLQYPKRVNLPTPMLGFSGGIVQWVFDRGQLGGPKGLLAAVISASGVHQELGRDALAARVDAEIEAARGALPAYRDCQVITERRATFSCTPGLVRPGRDTPLPGLLLAGDYVASDYPGTLEAAVRSGLAAADACR